MGGYPWEKDHLKKVYTREYKQHQELTDEQIQQIHGQLKEMKPLTMGDPFELTDNKIEINDDEPDPRLRGIKHEKTVISFLTARDFKVWNYQEKYIKEIYQYKLKLYLKD